MRRAGGTAAKASADIRRSFTMCSEAFADALIWVGISRIFFTYQVAYCSGFPLIPLHSIKPRRGAPPDV